MTRLLDQARAEAFKAMSAHELGGPAPDGWIMDYDTFYRMVAEYQGGDDAGLTMRPIPTLEGWPITLIPTPVGFHLAYNADLRRSMRWSSRPGLWPGVRVMEVSARWKGHRIHHAHPAEVDTVPATVARVTRDMDRRVRVLAFTTEPREAGS